MKSLTILLRLKNDLRKDLVFQRVKNTLQWKVESQQTTRVENSKQKLRKTKEENQNQLKINRA